MKRKALVVVAATLLAFAWPSRARASSNSDTEAALVVGAIALFDVAALPLDIYFAVAEDKVPREYAAAEAILGGLQASLGGIFIAVCGAQKACSSDGTQIGLGVFTGYTGAMAIHGLVSLSSSPRAPTLHRPRAKGLPVLPVPIASRTMVGVGLVGAF